MKLKLLKEFTNADKVYTAGEFIEIDDQPTCDQLINDGTAIAFTPELQAELQAQADAKDAEAIRAKADEIKAVKKLETKNFTVAKKTEAPKGVCKMQKGIVAKAIRKAIETKSVSDFSGVEATEVIGNVFAGSPIYDACSKRPLNDSTMRINYSVVRSSKGNVPAVGIIGEATANAVTIAKGTYDAHVAKIFATAEIPNEEMSDIEGIEDWVIAELRTSAGEVLDNSIINSPFTSDKGTKGLANDINVADAEISSLTKPTLADLLTVKGTALPQAQKKGTWIIAQAVWNEICALGLTADNIGGQLIKFGGANGDELLGRPVIVTPLATADKPIFFGDLSFYRIGEKMDGKDGVGIEVDTSCGFAKDVTTVRLTARVAGGYAASLKAYEFDEYDAIVKAYGNMVKAVKAA